MIFLLALALPLLDDDMVLLHSASPASEDKLVDVVCPVDGTKFKAVSVGYHPAWGGIDRDFCSHAVKGCPLELKVWVCPTCYYTGFKADFEAKAKPPADIVKNLKPLTAIPKNADQKKIPGTTKLDLLAQVRAARGDKPQEIAKAYLYGAWVVRSNGAVFPYGFEEFEELYARHGLAKNPLEMKDQNKTDLDFRAAAKIEKELETKPPKNLPLMLNRYLLVYIYRRHGEHAKAMKWIEVLETVKGENSILDQAVETAKKSIQEEKEFQKKAAEHFKTAAEKLTGKELADVEYILGELYRRLGEKEAAAQWFDKVIARDELKDLVKIAKEQKALLDAK
jgi:uncharacterized protein (DUF2225 family)